MTLHSQVEQLVEGGANGTIVPQEVVARLGTLVTRHGHDVKSAMRSHRGDAIRIAAGALALRGGDPEGFNTLAHVLLHKKDSRTAASLALKFGFGLAPSDPAPTTLTGKPSNQAMRDFVWVLYGGPRALRLPTVFRARLVEVLGAVRTPQSKEVLRALLPDSDWRIRLAAVEAIGQDDLMPADKKELLALLTRDGNTRVTDAAAHVLRSYPVGEKEDPIEVQIQKAFDAAPPNVVDRVTFAQFSFTATP